MTVRHRSTVLAIGVAASAGIALAATAGADPGAPDVPVIPGPAPVPVAEAAPAPVLDPAPAPDAPPAPPSFRESARGTLAQAGQVTSGRFGVPDFTADIQNQMLLGQSASPALPGAPMASQPHQNAVNQAYLLPQNVKPAAPGEGQVFNVDPGQENADINSITTMKQLHAMYRADLLKGALLTRGPKEALGQPLPGTAPPPGTVIPGLGNGLPDPEDPAAPAVPGAPAPILPGAPAPVPPPPG